MPMNIKHYVAIALGTGVAFFYAMHLNSSSDGTVLFHSSARDTQALSELDDELIGIPNLDVRASNEVARLHRLVSSQEDSAVADRIASDSSGWDFQWELRKGSPESNGRAVDDSENHLGATRGSQQGSVDGPSESGASVQHQSQIVPSGESRGGVEVEFSDDATDFILEEGAYLMHQRPFDLRNVSGNRSTIGGVRQAAFSTKINTSTSAGPFARPVGSVHPASVRNGQRRHRYVGTSPLSGQTAIQAVHHIARGKSLSRDGRLRAAHDEFLRALQLIASANDIGIDGTGHALALQHAILAMQEAKDFFAPDTGSRNSIDLGNVIASHQSGILSPDQVASMTPHQAIQEYFVEAQRSLVQAGGRKVVASEAMYCLGKLSTSTSATLSGSDHWGRENWGRENWGRENWGREKAIVFHQASLSSDPNNFRSSNELAVLIGQRQEHSAR